MRGLYHAQAVNYFEVAGTRQRPHNNSQRPDHIQAHVWSTNPFGCLSPKEVGVILTEHKGAGVPVNLRIRRTATQIWQRQQTGNIGVIHEELIAKTVYLVGVNHSS